MGLFDFLRGKPAAPPPPVVSAAPTWDPVPPLVAALRVGSILLGRPDAPEVQAVHHAIESALARAFTTPPLAFARTPPGPLALVRVYRVEQPGRAYFHYLGWGLTEMGPKSSPRADVSGFGIELSIKVRAFNHERGAPDLPAQLAPLWPVELLSFLALGIQQNRRPYDHDHWIGAGERGFGPENVRHLACAADDRIGIVHTPNGAFRFIQLYTIDEGELAAFQAADRAQTEAPVLAVRRAIDPDLVVERRR